MSLEGNEAVMVWFLSCDRNVVGIVMVLVTGSDHVMFNGGDVA